MSNSFNILSDLLSPLNETMGEHSVYVTTYPGSTRGCIEFCFDWKTIYRELEFSDYDEAISKAEQIIELIDKYQLITYDFHAENDRFNVDYDRFESELDKLLNTISTP